MQCPQASERMSLRLDGLLSPAEERALTAHMDNCIECRAEWALIQRAAELFGEVERAPAPPALADRVMARVHRRRVWLAYLRGGALLALGVVIMLALWAAPLMGLVGVAANDPTTFHAILSVFLQVVNLVGMLANALWLVVRAAFSSGGALVCIGLALFVGVLSVQWLRLVGRTSRLSVK